MVPKVANPILAAGSSSGSINAALATGGIISGTVTASVGGAALSDVCVYANSQGPGPFESGSATSAADGSYAISGLLTGSYSVEFRTGCGNSGNYEEQWYDDQASGSSATPVAVTQGSSTPSINATLLPGGVIAGVVTAATGGSPLSGVCVMALEEEYGIGWIHSQRNGRC